MATGTSNKGQLPFITVLGSLNMDLVSYVPHHPLPGETLTSTRFAVSPGGKGANQAVACAKLSRSSSHSTAAADDPTATARVRMLGAVGQDTYGTQLLSNLSRHGVDVSGVAASPALKSGLAIIIVDEPTGQNRIVLSPEANHSLLSSQFSQPSSLGAPLPHLLIMQLEIPLPTVVAALRAARNAHVPVLLNPAPARELPSDAYAGLAHLVVNETEASILGGVPESDLDTEAGLEAVGRTFLSRGVLNVVVTLGGRGVFYISADGQKGLVPAEKAKVVDTTAAGDTFVGQYALEVVSGSFSIADAVKKSNRAAAKTVERLGAQDSIPWRDEL
ncbi:Ribokinase-like protein [Daldinia decipiens]|uniref:Ribokinase-like protein n=1 Tax=Daldinia decipiens TaxID=326647 RepID=UPI0020C55B39|nr:Ribokinase-like protein [Daldinia decipiens]KAI1658528.1 Ribokinase-like protein [Daldinia decipiens]